ncbi:MAG: efflux RND transporter permease subunit, partial [Bacteroidota bacterium]
PIQETGVVAENRTLWTAMTEKFPGIGREFMPALDEGSFLLMPSSMPHAGMAESKQRLQQLDILISNIPEVEQMVGKLGRVESALDPAPISMYENVINYKAEYILNDAGDKKLFKVDRDGLFILTNGEKLTNEEAISRNVSEQDLIPDPDGNYFRNWRQSINSPDDIWNEIVRMARVPGVTSAPKLQPIETRLLMLQTGMRAPMGIKVYGPDLETIQSFGYQLESHLKSISSIKASSVFADRIVGKPYIELKIDREAVARYGINIQDVQRTIETAVGGSQVTTVIDGRNRLPVRVRYPRELRNDPDALSKILVATPQKAQIPLGDLVTISFEKGPQMIKSEETFLVGYVLFDKREGHAETDVVEQARTYLEKQINDNQLIVPEGVSYKFSGSYENQQRAEKRLSIILPLVLIIILIILYMQFKSLSTSLIVFAGVALAFSGGFIMLWLYSMDGFMNFSLFGTNMRTLFQIETINLSVAVWVGFIALFGIATDDGVLIATYLDQSIRKLKPATKQQLTAAVIAAGKRRIRPAIMTTVTTLIALLPVMTSTGKGADIMIPMAIPAFGGMLVASVTYFFVPVLYSFKEELKLKKQSK